MSSYSNVTKVTYPDSYYVTKVYDEMNRLTDVKLNGSTSSALEFDYDSMSRRTSLTYENGVVTDYNYDWVNDLNELVHTFDSTSVTFEYVYNDVHEITSQDVDDDSFMWHPASAGTTSYGSVNSMNQYPTVGSDTYSYNNNGCLTDDGTWNFTYDTENHLLEADDGSTTVEFVYDGRHRQAQKDDGTSKTRFVYSGNQLIAEYDGSGNLQKKYVFGRSLDEVLIELDSSNNPIYLHHDQLGSVVATSDTNGDMVNSYAYSPWGYCTNMAGTTFGFTGQRFDSETGLYYYKNRYFSPAIGRFLQPDPTGYDDDLNLYAYVGNSPLNFTDPLGLARVALAKYSNDGWNNSLVIPNNNKGTAIFTNSVFDLYKGPSLNGPVLNGSTGIIFNPGNCGCGCGECGGEGGGGGIASYPTNFNSPQANPTGNTPTSNASDDLDDYYNCIITCVGFTAPLAISTCALLSGGVLPAFVTCLAIAAAPAYAACLVFCGPKPPGKKLQKCSRYYIC